MKGWSRAIALVLTTATVFAMAGCSSASNEAVSNASVNSSVSDSEGDTPKSTDTATESSTQDSADVKENDSSGDIPSLRDAVDKKLGCRIGCAITGNEPWDPKLWNLVTTHFNAVTLGNELKPDSLFGYSVSVCPGTKEAELNGETITVPILNYNNPEKILNKILKWNEDNPDRKIAVRGHVLLWHSQTPEWFFHEDYDKTKPYVTAEVMDKRLEWYIREVLTHFTGEGSPYKDLFYGWDVVNEAVSDATGTYRTDAENPNEALSEDRHGNNSSWWHVYQNEDFIVNAFRYANKYAPEELELYYNDYNECDARKRAGIIELIKTVKEAEGTRIDAMGMQGHYSMDGPSINDFEVSIKAYGEVIGSVQITEWDLRATEGYDGSDKDKEEEYEKQRKIYNLMYYTLCSSKNSGINITGITFWGTIDTLSWLQFRSNVGGGSKTQQKQCPLLFDGNYEPKPAFWVFAEE